MTKRLLLISIMAVCFNLYGCRDGNVTDTRTNVESITENPEAYYEDACKAKDIVVQALNNKDLELFKSVLSNKTIEDTPHLNEEIRCAFDMYEGEVIEIREYEISYEEGILHGKKISSVLMCYDMVTTEKEYLLDMLYIPEYDEVFEKSGFYFVVLADYDREYTYFEASCPYTFRVNCGVFSSDLDTMEYNENVLRIFYKEEGFEEIEKVSVRDLNRVGVEKITELKIVKEDEYGVYFSVVDSINNKYYVDAYENGGIFSIRENDENGKIVLEGY